MKILVVDDNPENIEDARKQLVGYNVDYCNGEKSFWELSYTALHSGKRAGKTEWAYDVVLTDLIMPAGKNNDIIDDTASEFEGVLMGSGLAIAFMAIAAGSKYVGVVSLNEHHLHPIGTLVEGITYHNEDEPNGKFFFNINGGKIVFMGWNVVGKDVEKKRKNWKNSLDVLLGCQ